RRIAKVWNVGSRAVGETGALGRAPERGGAGRGTSRVREILPERGAGRVSKPEAEVQAHFGSLVGDRGLDRMSAILRHVPGPELLYLLLLEQVAVVVVGEIDSDGGFGGHGLVKAPGQFVRVRRREALAERSSRGSTLNRAPQSRRRVGQIAASVGRIWAGEDG